MKPFTGLAALVFALVALIHLLRVVLGWEVLVAGLIIPNWASVIACVVALVIAVMVWKENH